MEEEEIISKDPKFNASLAVLQSIHYHLEYAAVQYANNDYDKAYQQLKISYWFSAPILPDGRKEELKKLFTIGDYEKNEYAKFFQNYSQLPIRKRPIYNGKFMRIIETISELIPQSLQDAKVYFLLEDKSDLLKPEEEW